MSASKGSPAGGSPDDRSSEEALLVRALGGSGSAINGFFARYATWLRSRARGRLPQWARSGISTSDVVQDVLHDTYKRLAWFEARNVSAMRAYLKRAVENRVRDELRRATRRLDINRALARQDTVPPCEEATPQHRHLQNHEKWNRYRDGLKALSDRDRRLIVGRAELGYSYQQLAAVEGMPSAESARKAVGRAITRLSKAMSDEN